MEILCNKKKATGITLIALVITIIVLLILTAVSIVTLTGENGILTKSKDAKEKHIQAEVKEDIELTLMSLQTKEQGEGRSLVLGQITEGMLQEENSKIKEYSKTTHEGIYVRESKEICFKINEDFTVSFTEEDNNIEKEYDLIQIKTNDDVIKKWCKTVDTIQIPDLNELVKNEQQLKVFMNSKVAVESIIKNSTIMRAIASSETAMNLLGQYEYAKYKVLKDDEAREIILASPYIETFNRNNIITPELSGYVENLDYSSCNSDIWAAWRVFDRKEDTQWGTNSNEPLPNWMQYNFGENYLIYKIEIVNAYQSGMKEQSGKVYIGDTLVGNYQVKTEKEHNSISCLKEGTKVKVECNQYNWQDEQSYLSEIYVYGIKVPQDVDVVPVPSKGNVTIKADSDQPAWYKETLRTISVNTINDLVNNPFLIKIFMNSKNSVDYMITNQNILKEIANSETAMNLLGQYEYAKYKVLKDNEAREIILASPYIETFNRNNIITPELSGYVENLDYSSCNSDTWAAWRVFDRSEDTQWGTNSNETLPNWIQYNFGENYLIYKIEIVNAYQSGMKEQNGKVYIDEQQVGNYQVKTEKEHNSISCLKEGTKVKVECNQYNWDNSQSYLSEIYIYGAKVQR